MGSGAFGEFLGQCNILDKSSSENSAGVEGKSAVLSAIVENDMTNSEVEGEENGKTGNGDDKSKIVPSVRAIAVPPAAPRPSKIALQRGASTSVPVAISASRPSAKFASIGSTGRAAVDPSTETAPNSNSVSEKRTSTVASAKKGCDRTEAEMIFIAAAISGAKHENNSKRTLSRDQFIDALVFIAGVKYVRTKICTDLAEAADKLIQDHIVPYAGCFFLLSHLTF